MQDILRKSVTRSIGEIEPLQVFLFVISDRWLTIRDFLRSISIFLRLVSLAQVELTISVFDRRSES